MSEFKAGDRVEFIEDYNTTADNLGKRASTGDAATVSRVHSDWTGNAPVDVTLDKSGESIYVYSERLKRRDVEPKAVVTTTEVTKTVEVTESVKTVTLTLTDDEAHVIRGIIAHINCEPAEVGSIRKALESVGYTNHQTRRFTGSISPY